MAEKETKSTDWGVIDLNAQPNDPPRYHDCVVEGKIYSYGFKARTATAMPEAHARKFVPNETFEVFDENGRRIRPVTSALKGYTGERESLLEEDECVAKFDELVQEALYERAAPLPGGEKLTKRTPKADLITFLITARKAKMDALKPQSLREDDAGNRDEFSGAELERIMPSSVGAGIS